MIVRWLYVKTNVSVWPPGSSPSMPCSCGCARNARWCSSPPWAWGIIGCASVVCAVLAGLVAMVIGLTGLVLAVIGLYSLAALVASTPKSGQAPEGLPP